MSLQMGVSSLFYRGHAAPAIPDRMIDNFEDADADPAGVYESGETIADYYQKDTGDYQRTTSNVVEGSKAVETTTEATALTIISESGDGLNAYPEVGDTVSCLIRDANENSVRNGAGPILFVNSSLDGSGVDGYGATILTDNDTLRIWKVTDDSFANANETTTATISENVWYWLEISTGTSGDNTLTATLYEADTASNPPTRGTQLGSVSNDDSDYLSQTGIGVGRGSNNALGTIIDWIRVL
jgi:hypothetical protein